VQRSAGRLSVAALLAALVAALLAGCAGTSGEAKPVSTPAPSALHAGTYTSAAFRPAVTYTVPSGWRIVTDVSD
jgi:hypothetical protein